MVEEKTRKSSKTKLQEQRSKQRRHRTAPHTRMCTIGEKKKKIKKNKVKTMTTTQLLT